MNEFVLTSSTNDQGLARCPIETENIVARYSVLQGTGDVRIPWPSAYRDDDVLGRQNLFFAVLLDSGDRVGIFEITVGVHVLDLSANRYIFLDLKIRTFLSKMLIRLEFQYLAI